MVFLAQDIQEWLTISFFLGPSWELATCQVPEKWAFLLEESNSLIYNPDICIYAWKRGTSPLCSKWQVLTISWVWNRTTLKEATNSTILHIGRGSGMEWVSSGRHKSWVQISALPLRLTGQTSMVNIRHQGSNSGSERLVSCMPLPKRCLRVLACFFAIGENSFYVLHFFYIP